MDWKELVKTREVTHLGDLKINSKNLFVLAGETGAGKTISCLNSINNTILNKLRVLFFDTENKSVISRSEPNLFKFFYNKHSKLYDQYFSYKDNIDFFDTDKNEFVYDKFFECINKYKPDLIVIDSIYKPFADKFTNAHERAKKITHFLSTLKLFLVNNDIGCIITTHVGIIVNPKTKEPKIEVLGGRNIYHNADIRGFIEFGPTSTQPNQVTDIRQIVIDRQGKIVFKVEFGGLMIPKSFIKDMMTKIEVVEGEK